MELKIKIHPLFIIFAFFLIFFGWTRILISYFLVLILHELGHYFMAKFLGYKLNKIVFMPYGVSLNGQGNIFKKRDEILIAMAGPVVNFLLCILTVTLWWLFPVTYYYTDAFVFSNLSLALFNLIPVFPLDGGRVIRNLFYSFLSPPLAQKVFLWSQRVVSVFILVGTASLTLRLGVVPLVAGLFVARNYLWQNPLAKIPVWRYNKGTMDEEVQP